MDKNYEKLYHEKLERENWWFIGRRNLITSLVSKEHSESRVLDVGCSSGILMQSLLHHFSDVSGIDISKEAIIACKEKGIKKVKQLDAAKLKEKEAYDVIIASDILEHIEDDKKALSQWNKVLKKKGKLYLFVPAHNYLWTQHDVDNHHFRRYNKKMFLSLVDREQFVVERITYCNSLLYLPILLMRSIMKLLKTKQRMYGFAFNGLFKSIILIENKLLSKGMNFSTGVSLFVRLRKI